MTKNENLRLCGGTFFTLLLEARKQLLGANEHYAGKKDGLTEYETLIGLARVIRSDLATPMPTEIKTIQGNASEYKKCKNAGGGYFPFGDKTALRVFDERVKNEYVDTLRKMCRFVDDFIDAGGDIKKDELLVKALVELISLDNCIDDSQSFYIKEDGTTAQKKELINMKEIPLQSFLLGIGNHLYGDYLECYSAGTELKDQINQDAVRIVKELYGIDMNAKGHHSKLIDEIPDPDIAISMGCDVGCPFIGRPFDDDWGLMDPTGKSDKDFIEVIKEIEDKIIQLKNSL